jgi:hypothetical protein
MPAAPTSPLAVAIKVALDQGLQTPFGTALFFAALKLLEGRPAEALPNVRAKVRAGDGGGGGAPRRFAGAC